MSAQGVTWHERAWHELSEAGEEHEMHITAVYDSNYSLQLLIINIVQSDCRSPDISGVYDPIPAELCEQVGLWKL